MVENEGKQAHGHAPSPRPPQDARRAKALRENLKRRKSAQKDPLSERGTDE